MACLTSMPGGNPALAILGSKKLSISDVISDLEEFKCGLVRRPVAHPSDFAFTESEITAFSYPETAMYTIIQDNVYSMSGEPFCLSLSSTAQVFPPQAC